MRSYSNPYFEQEFFRNNRLRLRKLFAGNAPILVTANGLQQWSTDSPHAFKQDGNFWYLTGIDEPNIVLVMDKLKDYLIIPKFSHAREMFDGGLYPEELQSISGVDEVLYEKQGWQKLASKLKRSGSVAVLAPGPEFIEHFGMYTNPARRHLKNKIQIINPGLEVLDVRKHLARMRMVKQPTEIQAMTKAIDITIYGMALLKRKYQNGSYDNEHDAEIDLTRAFYKRGSVRHAFPPIIAAAGKGSTIHPMENHDQFKPNDPILIDVGAVYADYAADITRTWHNQPDKRFKAIHQSVSDACDYALSLLKPGVILKDYEKQMEMFMGEKLRELGLIKKLDKDEIRRYFPHAVSHFLGIDTHDVGDYDHPIEEGVVLTVEPGIYIPEENIGVRIEDDILITKNGCQNLSSKLDRSLN